MDLPVDVDELRLTLRRNGVVFAFLHGSRADGSARPDSDVDVAVWRADGAPDLPWGQLSGLPDEVDVVDLRATTELLAGRVATRGVLLLDDDPPLRVRWQADTRKRFADERFRREQYRRDFLTAHG